MDNQSSRPSSNTSPVQEQTEDELYLQWKDNIPLLYDSFLNHNLDWPCSTLAWGPVVTELKRVTKQSLYLTQSTDASFERASGVWRGFPNTIELATVSLTHPASILYSNLGSFDEELESPKLVTEKVIVHPGEVTRIKASPLTPSLVASHSSCKEVYIWDMSTQEHRKKRENRKESIPDLVLGGHTDDAPYALDFAKLSPKVVSGGADQKILIWDLEGKQAGKILGPCYILEGHSEEVLDVNFSPHNDCVILSSGADKKVLVWDLRNGSKPVMELPDLHKDDVNTVSMNFCDENVVVSGSSDGALKVTDIRSKETIYGEEVGENIINSSWNSTQTDFFVTSDEGGGVSIYNYKNKESIFRHGGHRATVESVEWNPYSNPQNHSEWTVASTSNDAAKDLGGGTLQIWRPLDLIYKKDEECLLEFQKYEIE